MKPKEELYKLIKSLSRSEKRYFTLDAKKSGAKSSNYLELFKAINLMTEYDESKLKKKNFPNLSMDKAYLYEVILKSMRDYRSPRSKRAQLKQRLMDAKFLYERGLYDQCSERLTSARSLATDLSDSLAILEINREERRLIKEKGIPNFALKFENIQEESDAILVSINSEFFNLDKYDFLSIEVGLRASYADEEKKKALIEKFNVEKWAEPKGVQAQLGYLKAKALYFFLMGEVEEASRYFQSTVDVWEKNPVLKREEFFRYIIDLTNVIAFAFLQNRMNLVKELLKQLENEKPDNIHEENLMFQKLILYRLSYLIKSQDFNNAEKTINEVEIGLLKIELKQRIKILIWLQSATVLMGAGEIKKSRQWLKKIIDYKKEKRKEKKRGEERVDLQKAARILDLLLVAETEDYDTVESVWRSYHRFFKNHSEENDSELEVRFLNMIKKIIPFPMDKKDKKALDTFLQVERNVSKGSSTIEIIDTWRALRENI